MQNRILFVAITTSITLGITTSCNKEEVDAEKPVITYSEPVMNDTIVLASGGAVHIEFSLSDNDELHEVDVNVTNGGTNIFTQSAHIDASTYTFHEHFEPAGITSLTPLTLQIDFSDHSANADSKTVTFYVKP